MFSGANNIHNYLYQQFRVWKKKIKKINWTNWERRAIWWTCNFWSSKVCSYNVEFYIVLPVFVLCYNVRADAIVFGCRQTPVEILHTILLGLIKYLFGKTMTGLSPADKKRSKQSSRPSISPLSLNAYQAAWSRRMVRVLAGTLSYGLKYHCSSLIVSLQMKSLMFGINSARYRHTIHKK